MKGITIVAVLAASTLQATAENARFKFPVPSVTVLAGDLLTNELVIERELVANSVALRNYYTRRADVVGKVAKRVIPAGSAIAKNALREPYAFKEGQRVALIFSSGALVIRSFGVAIEPGVVGRSSRIRNMDTGIVVTGIVQNDGSVAVGGS